jgi:hypothetical protein
LLPTPREADPRLHPKSLSLRERDFNPAPLLPLGLLSTHISDGFLSSLQTPLISPLGRGETRVFLVLPLTKGELEGVMQGIRIR